MKDMIINGKDYGLTVEPTEFGLLIREKRLERNLSMRKFAEIIDVSPAYISQIENKQFIPSEQIIKAIAEALNLNFVHICLLAGKIPKDIHNKIVANIKSDPERVKNFFGIKSEATQCSNSTVFEKMVGN